MVQSTVDFNAPFAPAAKWEEPHADDYAGRVVDGPFTNFNLFDSGRNFYVILFGRTISLRKDHFHHKEA